MKTYFLSLLETLINGYIELDPYSAHLRQSLFNKTIAIHARELPFPLYFHFTQERIRLLSVGGGPRAYPKTGNHGGIAPTTASQDTGNHGGIAPTT
ncbi:MAG: hypothetical protein K2Q14_00610, partial [Gammaproteobacteria bacterium]|nr:hypothetical protein [Gammaproteobacteria bacterium]